MWEDTRRLKIAFRVLVIASLILGWLAHYQTRFPGDLPVTLLLQSFQNQPFLTTMETISYVIADWRGIVVVIIAAAIAWRVIGALEGGVILLSGLFTGANEIFKVIVHRPRPTDDLVRIFIGETEKSFPSGHSFFAVAVFGFIAFLIAGRQTRKLLKILAVSAWIFLTVWIGTSRIYLGVHWASDVIGGYVVGAAFLMLEIWLYRRLKVVYDGRR